MDAESSSTPAGRLFARYLDRVEAGEELDFNAFCDQNPDLARELRQLHESLATRPGSAKAAGSSASRSKLSPIAQEIFDRLSGRPSIEGRYRQEGEVARGGMGAILRVWDQDLHRFLAMKVVLGRRSGETESADALDAMTLGRFLEEAQVTGQLDHPGIVPVHELGLDDRGRVFFTMKLVKGRDLKEIYGLVRREEEGWTRTRALGVLLRVCEAMAYAHDKGVVHRDLKPANIMVGRFGEVYVMDWGLAKVLGREDLRDIRVLDGATASTQLESDRQAQALSDPDSPLLTLDGDVLGTPAYMSPEQAQGRLTEMGPHSDVYSVGAMLYHLLAGHAPYFQPERRLTHIEVLALVRLGPPDPLGELAPDAPDEIVAICEKAMARDLETRYADMSELAEDLHAYMDGRVVRAYETGAVAELRKWVKRNRRLAAACLVAIVALVVGLAVSLTLRADAVRQRQNVLRLSAFQELENLRGRADALWPVHPDLIDEYGRWLADAEALVAELDAKDGRGGHRAQLQKLRDQARAADPDALEAARAAHPRHDELLGLERELAAREYARAVRREERGVEVFVPSAEIRRLPASVLNNDLAWPFVDPERGTFGREAEGLEVARLAVEKERLEGEPASGDLARFTDTLAWALFANGLDEPALEASVQALELAPDGSRSTYERNLELVEQAVEAVRDGDEETRLGRLREQVQLLSDEVSSDYAWEFEDERTGWWHGQLALLVHELEALDDPDTGLIRGVSERHGPGVERRLALAQRVRDLTIVSQQAERAWSEAIEAVAEHEAYGGLELTPQVGLLPLGPDPESDLWEFAHVASGEVPRRDASGALVYRPESCVVFVLVPGGSFFMGAQPYDRGSAHYDELAEGDESPVRELTLEAYFLSKFELTQAQWVRFAGANPSHSPIDTAKGGRIITGLHPVEQVSWNDCDLFLSRLGLDLPTEAQWERGARAGTITPWSSGDRRESLIGHANLADRAAKRSGDPFPAISDWPEFEDYYPAHAPVGTFEPNAFGLHDVHGNVMEWCRDWAGDYWLPTRPDDGERVVSRTRKKRVRGGSFTDRAADTRSSYRRADSPDFLFTNLGLRPARSIRP